MLKVEKTSPATDLSQYPVLLVYGPPKVGKSSFAQTFPKPLFLDFEDGLRAMGVDRVKLDTLDEFRSIRQDLKKDTEYKTLVFDTFDYFVALIVQEILREYKADGLNSGPLAYNRGRDILTAKLRGVITDIKTFPHQVLLLCHSTTKTITSAKGTSYTEIVLALEDKGIVGFLTGQSDAVMYMTCGTDYKDTGDVPYHRLNTNPDHSLIQGGPRMQFTGKPITVYGADRLTYDMLLADYRLANGQVKPEVKSSEVKSSEVKSSEVKKETLK